MSGALDISQLKAHLVDLRYKPGWSINVYEGAYEGTHLKILAKVIDSYDNTQTVDLDVRVMLPPFFSTAEFDRWLLWRLQRIEIHEAMEWFQKDGKPIFDPHRPHADRDEPIDFDFEAAA